MSPLDHQQQNASPDTPKFIRIMFLERLPHGWDTFAQHVIAVPLLRHINQQVSWMDNEIEMVP